MLVGKSASSGVVVGRALVLKAEPLVITRVEGANSDVEINRLSNAIARSKEDLQAIRNRVLETLGADKAQIFEAHLQVLEDPELVGESENLIRNEKINAETAFKQISQQFITMFETMDNE